MRGAHSFNASSSTINVVLTTWRVERTKLSSFSLAQNFWHQKQFAVSLQKILIFRIIFRQNKRSFIYSIFYVHYQL